MAWRGPVMSSSPGGASVPEPPAGREGPPGAVGQHQPQPAELRPVPQGLLRQRVRRLGPHQHAALPVAHLTASGGSFHGQPAKNFVWAERAAVGAEIEVYFAMYAYKPIRAGCGFSSYSPILLLKVPEHVNMLSDSVCDSNHNCHSLVSRFSPVFRQTLCT